MRPAIVGGTAYGVLVPPIVLEPGAANLEIITSLAALESAIGQDRAYG